jgi:hypothetical protein
MQVLLSVMIALQPSFHRCNSMWRRISFPLLLVTGFLSTGWAAEIQAPQFTYQGRLTESGAPAHGAFDFQFNLYEAPVGGVALASIEHTNVLVDQGVFTVMLDFGQQLADLSGAEAWLEISNRATASSAGFQLLEPRQPITPAPFAWFAPFATEAGSAQTAHTTAPGAVTSEGLVDHAVRAEKIAPGTVVRSLNEMTDSVRLLAGDNVQVDATAEGLRISATLAALEQTPISQMLWVDPVYGDDSTARRGLVHQPWLTLSNALAVVEDGDRLVLRPGVYTVERLGMPQNSGSYEIEHQRAPLLLKGRKGVTVDADGAIIMAAGLGSVLSIADCTNVTIRGLTFKGSGANPVIPREVAGEVVLWGTNSNVRFDQCRFEDFPNHGILVSQNEKTSYDSTVLNCVFRRGGTLQHGTLGLDGAAVASLGPGLRVTGSTFEDVVRGVEVEASRNSRAIGPVLVANNFMRNIWSAGVIVIPGRHEYLNDIMIANNQIFGDRQVRPGAVYQIGIRVHGGTRITVVGNQIGRCATDAINLESLAPLIDVSVLNNLCWENGARDIALRQHSNPLVNAVISDNVCLRNGSGPSIRVSGRNITVTDNTLVESGGPAIHAATDGGFATRNIVISGNRLGTTLGGSALMIDEGASQVVLHANHSSVLNPSIEDASVGTLKDAAFFGRTLSYRPTELQRATESGPILPDAYNIRITGLDGPVTVRSTPSIPAGLDGQLISLLGTSNEMTVTLLDQGVAPESGLGLGATSRTLGRGDVLNLRYDDADGIWWEVSYAEKP